jgi:Fe-S cluster assembly protein SufD
MPASIVAPTPAHESLTAVFAERERRLPGAERLRAIRHDAMERFQALGLPTTHNEEWKYTNVAPFARQAYEGAAAIAPEEAAHQLARAPFTDLGCPRLVFANGRLVPELSSARDVKGVRIGGLREAIEAGRVDGRLARYARYDRNALAALNTAFLDDGGHIEIDKGTVLEHPLHLVFLASPGSRPAAAFARNLVLVGRDAQALIVETYAGDGIYFSNVVTELVAEEGANVEHYKLQLESERALHFGLLAIEQGRSSNVVSHNVALGAALARNEIAALLNGEGAECTLNGLYAGAGTQHIDNYTTLDHAQPHSTSHELYKGVLDGHSEGVFHGRIIVRPEAQKTDAIQRNRNLLLSRNAVINTKPQLEIYADDVKCTHGATIGQVDQDAVFYLRSRGIPNQEARNLLTYAFTADIIERFKVEAIRSRLGDELFARLSGR